jgi:hypothetical protein
MDYGMIGQVAKAKHYAEERQRIQFTAFTVEMVGDNNTHTITYDNGTWHGTSSFFLAHGWSSHTVALEKLLKGMVTPIASDGSKEQPTQSSMISQVEKAKKYADEPSRVTFKSFTVTFAGENNLHTVNYGAGGWDCTANFFRKHGWSSHTMAVEHILKGMVSPVVVKPLHNVPQ